ncbi:MAG: hypothetical protein GTN36_06465 [Candidatus Aenigmarchaeota archaeon]|nr:hypothetical protein [Candidatus Aenigmarchaeota archaeon]
MLKKFFKPTWKKVLILIILPIIQYFITGLTQSVIIPLIFRPFTMMFFVIFKFSPNTSFLISFWGVLAEGVVSTIDLAYNYLISCIIVWIYDKVKKK